MKLFNYLKETKGELRHVSWPSRKTAINYTILVVIISIVISAYLGVFDYIFSEIIARYFV